MEINNDDLFLALFRHHKGLCLEGIASEILSEKVGEEANIITYGRDSYASNNPSKASIFKLRKVDRNKILTERIAKPKEKEVLNTVKCNKKFETAYEYHEDLLKNYGYSLPADDFSKKFSSFLASALQNIDEREMEKYGLNNIFVVDERDGRYFREMYSFNEEERVFESRNGKEISKDEAIKLAEEDKAYPSAITYYENFYLFIPGILIPNLAQLATDYANDDEKIKDVAIKGFKKVKEITGVYPLVSVIPDLNNQEILGVKIKYPCYLYFPFHRNELSENIKIEETDNVYKGILEAARKVVKYAGIDKKA